ncbi:MAG: phage tail tape measure protein [Clostridium sp.]
MAGNSRFNTMFSVDFESFDKVKGKLDALTGKLNKGNKIKLDIDTAMITKTVNDISKLTRQNIQILPNGQVKAISTFNSELGKTVKLTQNLSNGKTGISIDNNIGKNAQAKRKETEAMYKSMFDSIAQEEKLANQMGAGREKAEVKRRQEIQKTEQLQAQASNKAIEQQKREEKSARELIAIEKQKLDLRLKSIQANRGSLLDSQSIKNAQTGINNLSGSTVDGVKKKTQALNLELQRLDMNGRMKGLLVGNRNVMSLGDSIKATATKLGIFASSAMVFAQVARMIGEGVRYVKYLDGAFTDLSITMNVTQGQFGSMTKDIENMGKELGTSAKNVMDIAKVYANASTDINTVMSKINPAVMFSNISGMQGQEVTKTLQTVNQQFKLTEKEGYSASESIEHVGNVMTSVSQNMEYDFKAGLTGLNDAIRTSGSVAYESGMSLEQYTSYIGALMQSTGKSGDELGTFWKMLTARMTQIKGLGEEVGVTSEDMGKAETALAEFDIQVRGSNGSIRDMDSLLKDINGQWGELTDQERSYVAENVAGNRHRASFLSLMSSMTEQQKLYGEAMGSTNSLQEANDKYIDSWQGKLGSLTASFQSMMSTLLNGNMFKGGLDIVTSVVSGIDKLAGTIGTLPTIITGVVGALTIFNAKFRENFSLMTAGIQVVGKWMGSLGNIKTGLQATSTAQKEQIEILKATIISNQKAGLSTKAMSSSLVSLQMGLAMTTVKTIATTVAMTAMQAVISMGLSVAITAIIGGITKFCDSLIMTKSELKEFNAELANSVKESSGNITSVGNLLKEVTELEKQLSTVSDNDTRSQMEGEILDKRKQIAEIYPMTVSYIDSEGNAIASNNTLIETQIKLEKQKMELKAQEFIQENKNIAQEIQGLESKQNLYNNMRIAQMKGEKYVNKTEYMERDGQKLSYTTKERVSDSKMKDLNEEIMDSTLKMGQFKQLYASLGQDFINSDLGAPWRDVNGEIDNYTNSLEKNNSSAGANKSANDNVANGLDNVKQSAEMTKEAMDNLTNSFSESNNKMDLLKDAMEEFKKTGGLSLDTKEKFFSTGDNDLIAILGSQNNFLKEANSLVDVYKRKSTEAHDEIIKGAMASQQATNDDVNNKINAENVKAEVTANSANARSNVEKNNTDNNSQQYDADATNKTTSENNKQQVTVDTLNRMGGSISGHIGTLATWYGNDAQNYANSCNDKLGSTASFVNNANKMLGDLVNVSTVKIGDASITAFDYDPKSYLKKNSTESMLDTVTKQWNSGSNKTVNTSYTPVKSSYNPVKSTGSSYNPKDKKAKKDSGSKTDIKDTEVKIDRYKQLNDAIDDVNNSLSRNKILQDQATGKDKVKYMKEEIKLLNEKKSALKSIEKEMQKEAKELESSLSKKGLNAKNGDISNYVSKLEAQKKKVNSMSNSDKSKEKAIKDLEELIKQADRYFELTSKELPKIQDEWLELNSQIKEQAISYKNLMADTEREVTEMLKNEIEKRKKEMEKETDKLKEELQKRKDEYNKQFDDEAHSKTLKTKQEELAELEIQIEEASRDNSATGKAMLEELLKQKEAITDELNQIIKDKAKEEGNELFDKEADKIDKDLEDKLDKLDEKYTEEYFSQLAKQLIGSGFLEIEGKVVNLKEEMEKFFKENNGAYSDMNLQIEEINKNLELTKELYKELGTLDKNAGVKGGRSMGVSGFSLGNDLIPKIQLPSTPTINGRGNNNISISMPFTVEGNASEDVMPQIDKKLNDLKNEVIDTIGKELTKY